MKLHLLCFWLFNSGNLFYLLYSHLTAAQIVPDTTLPINTIATPQGNTTLIEGGTRVGTNLFHSFQQFSVPTGGEAFFNNTTNILNIFSRVTGRSISNIDGLIRANGTANLFLINPNGIIFGPNAQLKIGGSFLASTASSIKFADGVEFSANNPNAAPLLTINVPIGLQFASNTSNLNGAIAVLGAGHNLSTDPDTQVIIRDNRPIGLGVLPDRTLALIGGDVTLNGGNLTASSGRIELGSVAPGSLVTLIQTNSGWQLGYQGVQNFQDINLKQAASLDASGSGGGSIQLSGRRVKLANGAAILSLTEGSNSGGTLRVSASDSVELIGASVDNQFPTSLATDVQPKATGIAGDLIIETARLTIRDGAQVSASTFGQGKGGNLTIKATDSVELIGIGANGQSVSTLAASAQQGSTGDGGNLTIETGRLLVRDGAQILAVTLGRGKGGTLTVKATDAIEAIGESPKGETSTLATSAQPDSTGDAGDLTIETGRLILRNGGQIATATFGQGNAGTLTVRVRDSIEAIGVATDGQSGSTLATSAQQDSTGDGGSLIIETQRLILRDGGQISTATFGQGNAGTLSVKATDSVEVIGETANTKTASALLALAGPGLTGNAGDLTIETGRLTVRDGAQIGNGTFGQGKGGTLTVKATNSVELIGKSANGRFGSSLFANADIRSTGDAGDLTVETGRLIVRDGAAIGTNTFGSGKAGTLTVKATDYIELIGTQSSKFDSSLLAGAALRSTGDAGDLIVETGQLNVRDGATVVVRSFGTGKAGTLIVNADSIQLSNKGSLKADTQAGGGSIGLRAPTITLRNSSITTNATGGESGGNINIQGQFLQLRQDSTITTNAQGIEVKGGNITLNTDILAALENSDITANAQFGKGGEITINAQGIFGSVARTREELQLLLNIKDPNSIDPRQLLTSDITAISQQGGPQFQGTVTVNTPDVDPSSGLIELPVNFVDPTRLIAQGCPAAKGNSFTVTGRGGLPPLPSEPLRPNNTVSVDWVTSDRQQQTSISSPTHYPLRTKEQSTEIVEATGWVINDKGQVILIASAPSTANGSWLSPTICPTTLEAQ